MSWSTYQENMPSDSFQGDFAQTNYLNASAGAYTYYKRKHNPLQIFNSVANVTERAARIRNFNDFAVDVNASALPQWVFMTPNVRTRKSRPFPQFLTSLELPTDGQRRPRHHH